ncbi:hypothetical protein ACTWQL_12150 [Pseudalkalibacillus sp. R45]|uniref:hypothetical protein n=1 Tax=Pseudalkalibacillus sp. R45 TaxID=3457433 RepID=UPI003FCE85DF
MNLFRWCPYHVMCPPYELNGKCPICKQGGEFLQWDSDERIPPYERNVEKKRDPREYKE